MSNFIRPSVLLSLSMLLLHFGDEAFGGLASHAGFARFDGAIFSAADTYMQVSASCECRCRELCMKGQGICKSYCWIQNLDFVTCRLTNKSSADLTPESSLKGTTAVKLFPNAFFSEDRYLHVYQISPQTYDQASAACAALPGGGFQIGIYSSLQRFKVLQTVFNSRGSDNWVNMTLTAQPDQTLVPVWGNGIAYSDSEVSSVTTIAEANKEFDGKKYLFRANNEFKERNPELEHSVLCQTSASQNDFTQLIQP